MSLSNLVDFAQWGASTGYSFRPWVALRFAVSIFMGALLLVAGTVQAADPAPADGKFSVAGFAMQTDSARLTPGDGFGVHIAYGRSWTERIAWEAAFHHSVLDTEVSGGTDYYQNALGIDVSYRFAIDAAISPMVWLGAGGVYDDVLPDSDDGLNTIVSAALGFETRSLGNLGFGLRGRAVYEYDDFTDGMQDWRFELGIVVPFGPTHTVERVVYRELPAETVSEVIYRDPPDTDGDGVPDNRDDCPNTLAESATDNRGCVSGKQTLALRGVHFESGSATLSADAVAVLDGTFLALRDEPDIFVEVAGHTDSVGEAAANLRLSQARAEAVHRYLVGRGIPAVRLSARGYGEGEPLRTESSDEDRAHNRRVELRVSNRSQLGEKGQ